jgi:CheY-like chemotaxis protein/Tfp pilus assembly protein PilZ
MTEPSAALYDFAILTQADLDMTLAGHLLAELRSKHAEHPPTLELFGRPEAGEIVILLRFPFATYSTALRKKMTSVAERLKGRLLEPRLLPLEDMDRFYATLEKYAAQVDASKDERSALAVFKQKMGLVKGGHVYQLQLDSEEALVTALARCVAEGSLFVPTRRAPDPGAEVTLLLQIPNSEPFEADGTVLERTEVPQAGFRAELRPGPALQQLIARQIAKGRHGKRHCPEGGRRGTSRYQACLGVELRGLPELQREWTLNISKGGLFVRTEKPPPLRSRIGLRIALPEGRTVETECEVVHRVDLDEAAARHIPPGVGVAFNPNDAALSRTITQLLASLPMRRPQILVVDDDPFLREVLGEAFTAAGFEVSSEGDGAQALEALVQRLFELDLVLLDLNMPGLDGFCLIDRIHQLAPEADLKIVVLSALEDGELADLKESGAVADAIPKGMPLEEIVARVKRLLEPLTGSGVAETG